MDSPKERGGALSERAFEVERNPLEQHLIRGITAQLEKMPEGGGRAKGAFRKASLPPFLAALFPPPLLVCRHKRLALHKGQGQILFQKGVVDSSFVYCPTAASGRQILGFTFFG